MRKGIFIGSSVHKWNDPRVLIKEAVSLSKKYDVELHIPAPFSHRNFQNVTIIGLPEWKRKSERFRVILYLLHHILRSSAKVVHLHDPELIPVGLFVTMVTPKKVIFDFHEEYANKIVKRDWIPSIFRKPLAFGYIMLERIASRIFDGVIGVIEDQLDILRENPNHAIVKNYPVVNGSLNQHLKKGDSGSFRMVYLGDITRERQIHRLIDVAGRLNRQHNITLHLIGGIGDPDYPDTINRTIQKYNLDEKVHQHGYLSIDKAMEIVSQSDVGFLPLRHPKHFVRSLPVKLFDYMAAGIPVIMPEYPLSREVILTHNCGLLVDSTDLEDITEKVEYLVLHDDERKLMGSNGQEAVLKHFSWQSQEKNLFAIYDQVLSDN